MRRKNPLHHLSATEIKLLAYDLGVSESELLRSMDRLVRKGSAPKRSSAKKALSRSSKTKVANPSDRSMAALHRAIDRAVRKAEKSTNLRDIKAIRAELISDVGGASSRAGKIAAAQFDMAYSAPQPARSRTNGRAGASASTFADRSPRSLSRPLAVRKALVVACASGHNDDEEAMLRLLDDVARKIAATADGRALSVSQVMDHLESLVREYNKCASSRLRGSMSASTHSYIQRTFVPDMPAPSTPKRGRVRLVRF